MATALYSSASPAFSKPLESGDRSFDGILSSLAMHHVKDIGVPMAEFARLLRPDGWLVVTLDHPAAPYRGRPRPDYFATELITETWRKAGVTTDVSFWRRPPSAVVDAFAANGFPIERIREARLDEEARRCFPAEAASVEGSRCSSPTRHCPTRGTGRTDIHSAHGSRSRMHGFRGIPGGRAPG